MRPSETNVDEGRAAGASSSPVPMQTEGTGVEGFDNSSKKLEADKGESKGSSSTEIAALQQAKQAGSRVPLDLALKGLIISQIRAPFVNVEEGLLNLIKQCLTAEHPFFTSAALSGHVDHFQSVDDEDLGWGCGWRNIQILCSFLLAEDPESREVLFNGAGFVPDIPALQVWLEIAWSKGFDEPGAEYFNWSISGTRKWIGTTECAALLRSFGVRAKIVSFTALGGKRVRSDLQHKFGSPIDLSDDEGNTTSEVLSEGLKKCSGQTESVNSRGGAISCDECGKICQQGTRYRGIVHKNSDLCDDCMKAASQKVGSGETQDSPGKEQHMNVDTNVTLDPATSDNHPERDNRLGRRDSEHHWNFACDGCGEHLKRRRYKSLVRKNFDLCSNCMKDLEENPKDDRGSHQDYVIIEEFPASRASGPPLKEEEHGKDHPGIEYENGEKDQEEKSDDNKKDTSVREVEIKVGTGSENNFNDDEQRSRGRGGHNVDEDPWNDQYQKTAKLDALTGAKKKSPETSGGREPLANDDRRKAGTHGSSSRAENYDINHHHLIEWVWSYFTEDSLRRFAASGYYSRDLVTVSNRSPLYFQHRGHSRTIVGIERRRKADGISEDVYLLILDPSLSTELLVKSLREKSGWQKLIKNDVHTLKEAEYQLCYADPGIATGEELEQLKVLSSLRYSYYSK